MTLALPNLNDLATGYGHRGTSELYKNQLMFSLMQYPLFVRLGPLALECALKTKLPIRRLVKSLLFDNFCGGETLDQLQPLVATLAQRDVGSILDFAVEGTDGAAMLTRTAEETLANIQLAAQNRAITACVVKFSGIAPLSLTIKKSAKIALNEMEHEVWQAAVQRLETLCAAAAAADVTLMVDAEESWLQEAIDETLLLMMARFNKGRAIVYTTLQMYRRDRSAYLHQLHQKAEQDGFHVGIKLVRGAYLEKENRRAQAAGQPSPIWCSKEETDRAYDQALQFCLQHLDTIELCAGTHNMASILWLATLMERGGIAPADRRISFSQLLGMGDILTYNLAASGYRTAKYIPYGPLTALVPYLSRRMEENSAMRGQTAVELNLMRAEIRRRKASRTSGR